MSFVITIDGPAASGKSSVSRELAKKLNCDWVSTGSFYRGLAYVAVETKTDLSNEKALADLALSDIWKVQVGADKTRVLFQGKDVTDLAHQESVGNVASQISQYPLVRKMLLEPQRRCQSHRGLVAEGRDCGSVVFPYADLKVYLTADSVARALRRAQEKGASLEEIQKLQKSRDNADLSRKSAPLQVADGAQVIDTSHMDLPEVVSLVFSMSKDFI